MLKKLMEIKQKTHLSKLKADILLLSLEMSKKRTFDISFKREVLEYIDEGHTVYQACKFFSHRDKFVYNEGNFYNWNRNRDKILGTSLTKKRVKGGGRRPLLGELEDILANEIVEIRLNKLKVTRSFIQDRAAVIAEENGIQMNFGHHWVTNLGFRFVDVPT